MVNSYHFLQHFHVEFESPQMNKPNTQTLLKKAVFWRLNLAQLVFIRPLAFLKALKYSHRHTTLAELLISALFVFVKRLSALLVYAIVQQLLFAGLYSIWIMVVAFVKYLDGLGALLYLF